MNKSEAKNSRIDGSKICIDDLVDLKKYKGSVSVFSILPFEYVDLGNFEDGQDCCYRPFPIEHVFYVINNIYTKQANINHQPRYVLVTGQDNARLLIPFRYEVCPELIIGYSCTNQRRTLEVIEFWDKIRIEKLDMIGASIVDDGRLKAGHNIRFSSEEGAKKMETGHLSARFGCEYDVKLNAIKGEVDNLLAECKALW